MIDTSLRERKKQQTKQALQEQALRLFLERGYEATTIEEIAEAAGVSPRTFFRYFSTKEEVLVKDPYDRRFLDVFLARPTTEPIVESIRAAMRSALPPMDSAETEAMLLRTKLMFQTPELSVQMWYHFAEAEAMLAAVIGQRLGGDGGRLIVQAAAAAAFAALRVAIQTWAMSDGKANLAALLDESLDGLAVLGR
ncbi:MAG: TetR family transcriptional regulator [Thermomicrobiales bacterium]